MFYLTKFVWLMSVFYIFANGAPYQELQSKPGYVPVYIREGNTPLSQVHPTLVEAFHEYEESNQILREPESPNELEVANSYKTSEMPEMRKTIEHIEANEDNNSAEQTKQHEQEQKPPVSDIAELTFDDIKILADE